MLPVVLFLTVVEVFEVAGRFTPPTQGSVSIHRVLSPYTAHTTAEADGHFAFKSLEPGAYTLTIVVPSRGETRRTLEVGPSTADQRGRVVVNLELKDQDFVLEDVLNRRHAVTVKQLAIPAKAIREYEEADHVLAKNQVGAALKHLEHAVELAPQYAAAWNHLGTIAYQAQNMTRAAECFREALRHEPELFEALVNLGGVLLKLHQSYEAYQYNMRALLARRNDPLANAQFGMSYLQLGNADMAEKFLRNAAEIDPAHFSHPQLVLADIHVRRGDRSAAAEDLEGFLRAHPDWPQAGALRDKIAEWTPSDDQ